MRLPLARTEGIVVQDIDDEETLAYDLVTHQACCLNQTASLVYRACGAQSSFEELQREHGLTEEVIYLALDELKRANLLEPTDPYVSPFAGISRREAIKRAGQFAAMFALPVIAAMSAPTAAAAASGGLLPNNSRCTTAGQCESGNCVSTSFLPVGSFCCPSGNGGTQTGPIGTAIGLECFNSCSEASVQCCSGSATTTACDSGFCASQQQFCCACT